MRRRNGSPSKIRLAVISRIREDAMLCLTRADLAIDGKNH